MHFAYIYNLFLCICFMVLKVEKLYNCERFIEENP